MPCSLFFKFRDGKKKKYDGDWKYVDFKHVIHSVYNIYTICPRSSYQLNIITYYIKWVTPTWTHSIYTNRTFYRVFKLKNPNLWTFLTKVHFSNAQLNQNLQTNYKRATEWLRSLIL